MNLQVIDADGHVFTDQSLLDFIDGPYRKKPLSDLLPSLDFHHLPMHRPRSPEAFGGGKHVGPEEWLEFMEYANLECAVLYPTQGLSIGNVSNPDWACMFCQGYNNWLYERYVKANPRFKGVALLPLQDVEEAVVELRRAVEQLGMVAAMLPSRGLPYDLGHQTYWPIYAEAERLGCALGVHGGAHHGMALDTLDAFTPIHALGHPFSLMVAFSGMVYHGVFRKYPKLRMGFLEGGAGWTSFWMDRMARSHGAYFELGKNYRGPSAEEQPADFLRNGNVWIGCEGGEGGLAYQVERVGNEHFLFASDFPHEIGPGQIHHEINEILDHPELSEEDKGAILAENARRFYRL